jgi:hypothetical protein
LYQIRSDQKAFVMQRWPGRLGGEGSEPGRWFHRFQNDEGSCMPRHIGTKGVKKKILST